MQRNIRAVMNKEIFRQAIAVLKLLALTIFICFIISGNIQVRFPSPRQAMTSANTFRNLAKRFSERTWKSKMAARAPVDEKTLHLKDYPILIDSSCNIGNKTTDIIFYVHTRATGIQQRELIRQTWSSLGTFKGLRMRTVFVIGRDVTATQQSQHEIEADARKHGDVIQFDFADSYRNLTLKHVNGLRWVLDRCKHDLKADRKSVV